jgi:hypothetical protein
MAEEVKQSWSPKYILLILFVSLLTGGGGYGLKYLFDTRPKRILVVSPNQTGNLLDLSESVGKQLSSIFRLKNSPGSDVKSYFTYQASIRNAGNEAVEQLQISVEVRTDKVFLITPPQEKTNPKDLLTALAITGDAKDSTSQTKDTRVVSLLNPDEAISLEYVAYSTEKINDLNIVCVPRAKNWIVVHEPDIDSSGSLRRVFDTKLVDMTGKGILVILAMVAFAAVFLAGYTYLLVMLTKGLLPFIHRVRFRGVYRPDPTAPSTPINLPEPSSVQKGPKDTMLLFYDESLRQSVFRTFDPKFNIAGTGKATASSQYENRGPSKIFTGSRKGTAWTLNSASGNLEITWKPALQARYILFINRTSGFGKDSWGAAVLEIDGVTFPKFEYDFSGSTLLVVDLGLDTEVSKLRCQINGQTYPGLAGLEVYHSI